MGLKDVFLRADPMIARLPKSFFYAFEAPYGGPLFIS
jgi:hypothetical protein